jgi:LPS O-antigen subunit length determinant protein (WzzB/FepE family)
MRALKIIILIIVLSITALIIRNMVSFDYITYESTEDFIWYPQDNPLESFSFENLTSYELDIEVNSESEANEAFSKYIQDNYSLFSRMLNNDIHVKYDEINNGYYLYYSGFFFIPDTF